MTKKQSAERDEAIVRLRETLKPGDTVHTTLAHVSRSGMQREIGLHAFVIEGRGVESTAPGGQPTDYIRKDTLHTEQLWLSGLAARAMGYRLGKRDGIIA